MKYPSTILQKTLLAISIILLPIVISFVLDYDRNKEHLKTGVLQELTVIAEGIEGQVYQFLEMSKRRAYDFSTDGFLKESLTKINAGNKDAVYALNIHLLNEKRLVDATINRINIISMNGRVIAATDVLSVGKDVSKEDFFRKGLTGLNIIESNPSEERQSELAVTSVVTDRNTRKPIGMLVNFISLSELNEVMTGEFSKKLGALTSDLGRKDTLDVYLVNKDHLMISDSRFIKDAILKVGVNSFPVNDCLNTNKESKGFYKDYRGVEVAGSSMCIPSMKWTLLAEIDSSEGFAPLEPMRRNAMTGGTFVIGLILLYSLYIFKKMVLPLRKVYTAAENIAGGNYDVVIPVETGDEIGVVSSSINRMARDIKERTKLLVENEGQLSAIIDNSEAVIYLKDREGRYLLINKRFAELFHITKEGIKGKTDFDIFPENIASSFRTNDIEVLKVKRPVRFDESVPQENSLHYYISIKVPVFDSCGVPFATCGISTDITERKQMEDENNLLKNISMSIATSGDFDSALKEALARICEFAGWSFGEVWFPCSDGSFLEYSSICYYRDDDVKRFYDLSKNYTFPKGVGLPGRVWLTKRIEWLKDITSDHTQFSRSKIAVEVGIKACLGVPIIAGEDVLAVLIFFMSDLRGEDKKVIDIVRAVTAQLGPLFQQKNAEDLRYEMQQQLIQAQKMEAIGLLAGGIAHDFNNILTAIIGYGTILLMKRESDELIKKNTGNILALCGKAANLTQGLLTFSKRHQMNMDVYNLNEIIKSSGKMIARIIGEEITVKISLTDNELKVKADFSQIEQVMLNLATNSKDAMPEGCILTLSTSLITLDEKYITLHGYGEPGDYALITFSDTGTGIDEELKMKIFDPFFTTKEVGKGTGLGLSIVFGIIKQHNGFIDVYSEPGKGTIFNIYIPITKMLSDKRMPITFSIQKEKKFTILIAEDEEEVRNVMANTLREFGYNVIEAVDGEDALMKFMENKDSVRLLFFDIVLPNKNGIDSYEEIRKIRPDVKVIFTSGYSLDIEKVNKIQLYGSDFIPKPISPTVLYKKVSQALNSLTTPSPP